ncbi:DNA polymerase I [Patescibacteria group bacterium]|nr:DNA polymerase I [Patescibacteria group bacterium]MBU1673801.1 DNA polymerase I [Patescibacteria group bacterium]MBU1963828.1 DNA polymerase I [Patescibacteria group bacterium]
MAKKKKFIVIDGNALIHRAFHALPPLKTKDGELVNAVYGFVTILFRVIKDLKPEYAAVTFDVGKDTFRHKKYKEYKATREKTPQELYDQIPKTKEIVKAFNIPMYENPDYEADDLIGTICKKFDTPDIDTYVVTGDMDALQLVDKNTFVYTMKRSVSDTVIYDIKGVEERYGGLGPDQMIDYKALRGDPSDNIPGVKGIGDKGAINLLNEYKDLDGIYKNIDKIKGAMHDKLEKDKDNAYFSKDLATIVRDVPLEITLKETELGEYDREKLIELFQEFQFKSLLSQIEKVPAMQAQQSLFGSSEGVSAGGHGDVRFQACLKNKNYHLIDDNKKLDDLIKKLDQQKEFAFDTETTGLDLMEAKLLGISFSFKEDEGYYVAVDRVDIKKLQPIFLKEGVKKIAHNLKFDWRALGHAGLEVKDEFFDTMVASYLLNPGTRQHKLDTIAFNLFGYEMMPIADLIGKGKDQISMEDVPIEKLYPYACEDADFTYRIYKKLSEELKEKNLEKLFEEIEMPLIPVLAVMEDNGVKIDDKFLKKMQNSLATRIGNLQKKIWDLGGREFNIASPAQMKEVLFEKLEIDTSDVKKIKTGLSTAAGELEKMKGRHPIIELIMEYRELTKLQSTYVKALPKLISPADGRVHTDYNQIITATGRLSSSNPNLQNIPIRTELGREIRKAFIPEKGKKLIAADYSQIELRIVASIADDEKMLEAFNKGEDIHAKTAGEINGVSIDKVTKEMRQDAKAVNFGIIYGMGPMGLARGTGLTMGEARDYMAKYFDLFSDVKKYIEETKVSAHQKGYVETLFGRVRYLPDIESTVPEVQRAAERMAINMPVQGTAADMIKLAMIRVQDEIDKGKLDAKMTLQVHDELVFEVAEKKVKEVGDKVEKIMEGIYKLKCPVVVDVEVGDNWGELEEA